MGTHFWFATSKAGISPNLSWRAFGYCYALAGVCSGNVWTQRQTKALDSGGALPEILCKLKPRLVPRIVIRVWKSFWYQDMLRSTWRQEQVRDQICLFFIFIFWMNIHTFSTTTSAILVFTRVPYIEPTDSSAVLGGRSGHSGCGGRWPAVACGLSRPSKISTSMEWGFEHWSDGSSWWFLVMSLDDLDAEARFECLRYLLRMSLWNVLDAFWMLHGNS